MKKTLIYSAVLMAVLVLFSFIGTSNNKKDVVKGVKGTITNTGKTGLSASVRTPKGGARGSISYSVPPGEKRSYSGELGDQLEVKCNGKKQNYSLSSDSKQNNHTYSCN